MCLPDGNVEAWPGLWVLEILGAGAYVRTNVLEMKKATSGSKVCPDVRANTPDGPIAIFKHSVADLIGSKMQKCKIPICRFRTSSSPGMWRRER